VLSVGNALVGGSVVVVVISPITQTIRIVEGKIKIYSIKCQVGIVSYNETAKNIFIGFVILPWWGTRHRGAIP